MEKNEDEDTSAKLSPLYLGTGAAALVVLTALVAAPIILCSLRKWCQRPKRMVISKPQSYHGRLAYSLTLAKVNNILYPFLWTDEFDSPKIFFLVLFISYGRRSVKTERIDIVVDEAPSVTHCYTQNDGEFARFYL